MTITAQSVARRVVNLLQDIASTRWPLSEVVQAINEAQLTALQHRPDLFALDATLNLVAGTRQNLPAAGSKLMRIVRNNTVSSKKGVRLILMEHLDAVRPGWHGDPSKTVIDNYMVDEREPTVFYVYPPAAVGAALDAVYAAYPGVIAEPAAGTSLPASSAADQSAPTVITGNVSVPDEVAFALSDFAVARLLMKNGNTSDVGRASAHFQQFALALGIELKGRVSIAPISSSPFNPLYPSISQPLS